MSVPAIPPRTLAAEASARLIAGSIPLLFFFPRAFEALERTRSPVIALLILSEAVGLLFVLTARFTADADRSARAMIATGVATIWFVVVQLSDGIALLPAAVAATLQAGALLFQLFAKLSLGRSFGLVPANRGVVERGAYRLVRHPIYLGYLLGHIAFLCAQLSARNVIAFALLWCVQLYRIRLEEAVLARDPRWSAYRARVRWRLVPGLY